MQLRKHLYLIFYYAWVLLPQAHAQVTPQVSVGVVSFSNGAYLPVTQDNWFSLTENNPTSTTPIPITPKILKAGISKIVLDPSRQNKLKFLYSAVNESMVNPSTHYSRLSLTFSPGMSVELRGSLVDRNGVGVGSQNINIYLTLGGKLEILQARTASDGSYVFKVPPPNSLLGNFEVVVSPATASFLARDIEYSGGIIKQSFLQASAPQSPSNFTTGPPNCGDGTVQITQGEACDNFGATFTDFPPQCDLVDCIINPASSSFIPSSPILPSPSPNSTISPVTSPSIAATSTPAKTATTSGTKTGQATGSVTPKTTTSAVPTISSAPTNAPLNSQIPVQPTATKPASSPTVITSPTVAKTSTSKPTVVITPSITPYRSPSPTVAPRVTNTTPPLPTIYITATPYRTNTTRPSVSPTITKVPTKSITISPTRSSTPYITSTPGRTVSISPTVTPYQSRSATATPRYTYSWPPTIAPTRSPYPTITSYVTRTSTPRYTVSPSPTTTPLCNANAVNKTGQPACQDGKVCCKESLSDKYACFVPGTAPNFPPNDYPCIQKCNKDGVNQTGSPYCPDGQVCCKNSLSELYACFEPGKAPDFPPNDYPCIQACDSKYQNQRDGCPAGQYCCRNSYSESYACVPQGEGGNFPGNAAPNCINPCTKEYQNQQGYCPSEQYCCRLSEGEVYGCVPSGGGGEYTGNIAPYCKMSCDEVACGMEEPREFSFPNLDEGSIQLARMQLDGVTPMCAAVCGRCEISDEPYCPIRGTARLTDLNQAREKYKINVSPPCSPLTETDYVYTKSTEAYNLLIDLLTLKLDLTWKNNANNIIRRINTLESDVRTKRLIYPGTEDKGDLDFKYFSKLVEEAKYYAGQTSPGAVAYNWARIFDSCPSTRFTPEELGLKDLLPQFPGDPGYVTYLNCAEVQPGVSCVTEMQYSKLKGMISKVTGGYVFQAFDGSYLRRTNDAGTPLSEIFFWKDGAKSNARIDFCTTDSLIQSAIGTISDQGSFEPRRISYRDPERSVHDQLSPFITKITERLNNSYSYQVQTQQLCYLREKCGDHAETLVARFSKFVSRSPNSGDWYNVRSHENYAAELAKIESRWTMAMNTPGTQAFPTDPTAQRYWDEFVTWARVPANTAEAKDIAVRSQLPGLMPLGKSCNLYRDTLDAIGKDIFTYAGDDLTEQFGQDAKPGLQDTLKSIIVDALELQDCSRFSMSIHRASHPTDGIGWDIIINKGAEQGSRYVKVGRIKSATNWEEACRAYYPLDPNNCIDDLPLEMRGNTGYAVVFESAVKFNSKNEFVGVEVPYFAGGYMLFDSSAPFTPPPRSEEYLLSGGSQYRFIRDVTKKNLLYKVSLNLEKIRVLRPGEIGSFNRWSHIQELILGEVDTDPGFFAKLAQFIHDIPVAGAAMEGLGWLGSKLWHGTLALAMNEVAEDFGTDMHHIYAEAHSYETLGLTQTQVITNLRDKSIFSSAQIAIIDAYVLEQKYWNCMGVPGAYEPDCRRLQFAADSITWADRANWMMSLGVDQAGYWAQRYQYEKGGFLRSAFAFSASFIIKAGQTSAELLPTVALFGGWNAINKIAIPVRLTRVVAPIRRVSKWSHSLFGHYVTSSWSVGMMQNQAALLYAIQSGKFSQIPILISQTLIDAMFVFSHTRSYYQQRRCGKLAPGKEVERPEPPKDEAPPEKCPVEIKPPEKPPEPPKFPWKEEASTQVQQYHEIALKDVLHTCPLPEVIQAASVKDRVKIEQATKYGTKGGDPTNILMAAGYRNIAIQVKDVKGHPEVLKDYPLIESGEIDGLKAFKKNKNPPPEAKEICIQYHWRWHTKYPDAPTGGRPVSVLERVEPGDSKTGRPKKEYVAINTGGEIVWVEKAPHTDRVKAYGPLYQTFEANWIKWFEGGKEGAEPRFPNDPLLDKSHFPADIQPPVAAPEPKLPDTTSPKKIEIGPEIEIDAIGEGSEATVHIIKGEGIPENTAARLDIDNHFTKAQLETMSQEAQNFVTTLGISDLFFQFRGVVEVKGPYCDVPAPAILMERAPEGSNFPEKVPQYINENTFKDVYRLYHAFIRYKDAGGRIPYWLDPQFLVKPDGHIFGIDIFNKWGWSGVPESNGVVRTGAEAQSMMLKSLEMDLRTLRRMVEERQKMCPPNPPSLR